MRTRERSPSSARLAFTLVELMVVIIIIGVLAALIILIIPKLQYSQSVARGADVVQGQLFLAKNMALRDQLPRGVRFIPNAANTGFSSVQLIEQPLPYNTGLVTSIAQTADGPGPTNGWFQVAFSANVSSDFANNAILPGDYLDLKSVGQDGYTDNIHALHKIMLVQASPAPTIWVLSQPTKSDGTLWPASPPGPPLNLLYRIVRSARPMIGVNPVALPTDIVVDRGNDVAIGGVLGKSLLSQEPATATPTWPPAAGENYDIMFAPSGKVLGVAGTQGKAVLWIYDPTGGTPEQVLVGVFTRTGNIATQPVNEAAGGNPYQFIQDGTTSGM